MKTLQILFATTLLLMSISVQAIEDEDHYNRLFCEEMQGKAEHTLDDKSRVDCLTDTHAFEADWADGSNVYSAIGQALYYASETGRLPGILLLIRYDNSEKHIRKVKRVIEMYPDFKIQLIVRDVRSDGVSTSYSAVSSDLNDGLIGFYPFNGNVQDESGKGNHGSINGVMPINSYFGTGDAYYFDGTNDYIELPPMGVVNELTFATWFSANTVRGLRSIRSDRGWNHGSIHLHLISGFLQFSLSGNTPVDQDFDYYFDKGRPHHIAVTYSKSGKSVKLYVNGVFEQEKTYEKAISPNLRRALIGDCDAECDIIPRPFDGIIDEFRVYNRALSSSEVTALYNSRDT